jgi:hypothetical protein
LPEVDVEVEKVPVKSAAVFDLTTLENGKPRAFSGEWEISWKLG